MPVVSQDVAYRVEVSGWDSRQEFFVEKTDLEWTDESGKLVLLSHPVAAGSLLFLRLLHPTSLDRLHPIPYQAEPLAPAERLADKGQHRVRLLPALPRMRANGSV